LLAACIGIYPAVDSVWASELPNARGLDAYQPAVSFGGGVYLVCWKSGHLAPGDLRRGLSFIADIVACRVKSTGKVLDASPFVVCGAGDLQERPRIAFGAGLFLVVWQDFRNGKDWDVYAARVTPEGKVLDGEGIQVAGGSHSQALPDVAWDGGAFQVVWQDFRSGNRYQIYGARVSPEGEVLDPGGRLLVSEEEPYSRINPVVASSGNGKVLLFWLGGGRRGSRSGSPQGVVAGCHLLSEGRVTNGPTFVNPSNGRSAPGASTGHMTFPIAASAGRSAYLAAWTTNVPYGRGNAPNDAQAALFSPDGCLQKKFLLTGGREKRIRNPAAVWVGDSFCVVWDWWKERRPRSWPVETVASAFVSEEGEVSDPRHVAGSEKAPAVRPAVASDGKGHVLVVYERHPSRPEIPIKIGLRFLGSR